MKRKIILFVFILNYLFIINSNKSFSQAFPISEQQSEYFSIDHFANDVYYIHRFTGEIIKRNLHTMESSYTQFSSLPAFGHKSHFAIYFKDDLMYKYDFEKDSTYLLLGIINIKKESNFNNVSELMYPGYVISPNDNYMLLSSGKEYYSFGEGKKYPTGIEIFGGDDWSSDTTVVIYGEGENILLEYSFIDNTFDTLLAFGIYDEIRTYSYNIRRNILAYSLFPQGEEIYPKIYLYNKNIKETIIAFDPEIDDSTEIESCWSSPVGISSLEWLDDESKLAFFSFGFTNSFSGIYIYDLDLDTTFRYTECEYYGRKYDLDWYNEDTLVYVDYSTIQVFGFDATSPITSVQEIQNQNEYGTEIVVNTYPNPFNNNVKIEIIGKIDSPEITIYDVNGRQIKTFKEIKTLNGKEHIEWQGTNNADNSISSGIYFIVISDNKKILVSKKINYLK